MEYMGPVPSMQLKSLVLDEVAKKSALEKQSLWASVESMISDVSFDADMLSRLFGKASPKPSKDTKVKIDSGKKKKVKELGLIEPKRMHNLNISLSRMKIPHDELCAAIVRIDVGVLDAAKIDVLKLCLPMPQELKAVQRHAAKKKSEGKSAEQGFGKVETFFLVLGSIKRLNEKIRALDVRCNLRARVFSIRKDITILREAMQAIHDSHPLKRMMTMVLRLSNYMNYGTYHAGAFGFKVSSLKKLANVRSNNQREAKTLLHAIVKMSTDDKGLRDLESLLQISQATFIQTSSITLRCKQIQQDLSSIENEQAMCADERKDGGDEGENAGHFVDASTELLAEAHAQLAELEALQKLLDTDKEQLAAFLCEDLTTFKVDACIKDVYEFVKSYSRLLAEEKRQVASRARRAAVEEAKAKKQVARKKMKNNLRNTVGTTQDVGKQGRVSGLLDVLSVGSLSNFRGGAGLKRGRSALLDLNAIDIASPRASQSRNIKGHMSKRSLVMHGDADEDSSSDDSSWDSE
jgi:hypothetical protein